MGTWLARVPGTAARSPRRSLRCRMGLHAYLSRHNERGETFQECRRCKKYRDPTPFMGPVGRGPFSG